jgi:hypothetical protein
MPRIAFAFVLVLVVFCPAFAFAQQPCVTPASAAGPAGFPEGPIGGKPQCAAVTREITCRPGGGYVYTFTVTNNTGEDVTDVLVTPPVNANYTITPQTPALPGGVLGNTQQVNLQVIITGGQAGDKICFSVTLMARSRGCCTVQLCVELPQCCATFSDTKVVCNKDGTYTVTTTIKNNTSNLVQHIYLYAPSGTTITKNYFQVNLAPNASQQITFTVSGAKPGPFCFGVSLHGEGMKTCCRTESCIKLPECGTPSASCGDGVCCSRAPAYDGTKFVGQKIAAVTSYESFFSQSFTNTNVLTVMDVSGANAFTIPTVLNATANNTPLMYNGPSTSLWNLKNLGSIFGLTIDHLGNIYVTATSAYSDDQFPHGPGRIYRIDNITGKINDFNAIPLPNTLDPAFPITPFPALGNIAFECPRKKFFVTNMDDGRIYRLNMSGVVEQTFDHATKSVTNSGAPEVGDAPGFAPLGQRIWGVQVHNGRVYYSVWWSDCAHTNAANHNQIYSVGLDLNGDFDGADRRFELDVPFMNGATYSNPVSDITFGPDGRMLLAERSMSSATQPTAHSSRLLEYFCTPDGWSPAPAIAGSNHKYNVGIGGLSACGTGSQQPANTAGGIDYDYDPAAKFGVWATGDALIFPATGSGATVYVYGVEAFPLAGGKLTTSAVIDLDGQITATPFVGVKMQIGDVEISCPPHDANY